MYRWCAVLRQRPERIYGISPWANRLSVRPTRALFSGGQMHSDGKASPNKGYVTSDESLAKTAPLAERQLARIFQSGMLDRPSTLTKHTRSMERAPKSNIQLSDPTP